MGKNFVMVILNTSMTVAVTCVGGKIYEDINDNWDVIINKHEIKCNYHSSNFFSECTKNILHVVRLLTYQMQVAGGNKK